MQPGPDLILGQYAFLEETLHQAVVGLRHVLDQFAVQRLHAFGERSGRLLGVGSRAAGVVDRDLVAYHVEGLTEARPGVQREGQRKYVSPEMLARIGEDGVEVDVGLVEAIHHDGLGQPEMGAVLPGGVGADAEAVRGVDHDQGRVAHPHRPEALRHEVAVAGAIEKVELPAGPLRVEERAVDRDAVLPLARVVVRDRGSGGDRAEPAEAAGADEHRLAEHGFAGRGMAEDGEASEVGCGGFVHRRVGLRRVRPAAACGRVQD